MLERAAAVLEANLASVSEEWLASRARAGLPGPSTGDPSGAVRSFLAGLAQEMREEQPAIRASLEEQACEMGRLYQEQGRDLRSLAADYALLRDHLWQLFRHHLRAGDVSVVDLVHRLEGSIERMLLAAVQAYSEAQASALAEEAAIDSLTGVYHRGYLMERLAAEVERGERYQHSFAILLVDLDGLKAINDTLGHQAGDEALRRLADVLRSIFRKADLVGRYGGDEFVAVLPETPVSGALSVASRLGHEILDLAISAPGGGQRLSASIGVATYPECGTSVERLVAEADRAMYEAKGRGGNAVAVSSSGGKIELIHLAPAREEAPPTVPAAAPEAAEEPKELQDRLASLEKAIAELGVALDRLQKT